MVVGLSNRSHLYYFRSQDRCQYSNEANLDEMRGKAAFKADLVILLLTPRKAEFTVEAKVVFVISKLGLIKPGYGRQCLTFQ